MRSPLAVRHLLRIAALIVLPGTRLTAQALGSEQMVHRGEWIVGGSGSLDMASGANSQIDLTLNPQAMIFANTRIAVGASSVLSVGSSNNSHSAAWGIGPTARLFLDDVSNRVLPFVSASVVPEWYHQFVHAGIDVDENILSLDGSFGLTYLLSSKAGVTGEAYATHFDVRSTTPGNPTSSGGTTHYGLRFGFTVFVH
jgi:hypothetical protein